MVAERLNQQLEIRRIPMFVSAQGEWIYWQLGQLLLSKGSFEDKQGHQAVIAAILQDPVLPYNVNTVSTV